MKKERINKKICRRKSVTGFESFVIFMCLNQYGALEIWLAVALLPAKYIFESFR